jgi:translation initiation factor 2B subunit (eIF-2B alpha/beta/delta family)
MTGADAVLCNGKVINGVPSALLAQNCLGSIPFIVVAESIKYVDEVRIEDGYDTIEQNLISEIITDQDMAI